MPISKRFRLILTAVYFCSAYAMGMKILFGLSTIAPVIVTVILFAGTAIAFLKVRHAARLEGAKPASEEDQHRSRPGAFKSMAGAMAVVFAVVGAFQFSPAAGVAVIMLIIFGFMIAMVLIFVFARIEVRTRAELAATA